MNNIDSKENILKQIEVHRQQIDQIDIQMLELINKRATHSFEIRKLKPLANMGRYDAKREEDIFENIRHLNNGPLYNESLCDIYERILKIMKEAPIR